MDYKYSRMESKFNELSHRIDLHLGGYIYYEAFIYGVVSIDGVYTTDYLNCAYDLKIAKKYKNQMKEKVVEDLVLNITKKQSVFSYDFDKKIDELGEKVFFLASLDDEFLSLKDIFYHKPFKGYCLSSKYDVKNIKGRYRIIIEKTKEKIDYREHTKYVITFEDIYFEQLMNKDEIDKTKEIEIDTKNTNQFLPDLYINYRWKVNELLEKKRIVIDEINELERQIESINYKIKDTSIFDNAIKEYKKEKKSLEELLKEKEKNNEEINSELLILYKELLKEKIKIEDKTREKEFNTIRETILNILIKCLNKSSLYAQLNGHRGLLKEKFENNK